MLPKDEWRPHGDIWLGYVLVMLSIYDWVNNGVMFMKIYMSLCKCMHMYFLIVLVPFLLINVWDERLCGWRMMKNGKEL